MIDNNKFRLRVYTQAEFVVCAPIKIILDKNK